MQVKNRFDLTQFDFLGDNVLIKALKEESVSELIKPDQYDEKPEFGEVVRASAATNIPIGSIVFFGKYSTEQTRNLSQDYYIIRVEDIKAVLLNDRHSENPPTSNRKKSLK